MAVIMGEEEAAITFRNIWTVGREKQDELLWSDSLGYYIEKTENLPNTLIMADAVSLDMFLGQWWANQLNLGQIYPVERTKAGLKKIYTTNRYTDTGEGYKPMFRDFLGTGDTGWQMFMHTGEVPENSIYYYSEVMSGFEYAAAATMLQNGMLEEGLGMVKAISKRYDGRFRSEGEVHMANNSCVFGTGSPFGEDECGDFYVRPLSSWSVLLALQGFIFDGPEQTIGFRPVWQPEDHASFFSASEGWGLFTQTRDNLAQASAIEVKYGRLKLKNIILALGEGHTASKISVELDGLNLAIDSSKQDGNIVEIQLKSSCTLPAGSTLRISVEIN
jgi:hypothetical protein